MTDAELITAITELITDGGNSTTAEDVRTILTNIVQNKHNSGDGHLTLLEGGTIKINGSKVVDERQSAVADANANHDLRSTYDEVEMETAMNALGTKINSILTVLRNHGLIAT